MLDSLGFESLRNALADTDIASVFTPDILLPSQYDRGSETIEGTGVRRLMLAVLENALRCYANDGRSSHTRRLRVEATDWLLTASEDHLFCSTTVLSVCWLNPVAVREAVRNHSKRIYAPKRTNSVGRAGMTRLRVRVPRKRRRRRNPSSSLVTVQRLPN